MHNIIRVVGNNDISSIQSKGDARANYLVGVLFWPLLLSVLLLLWTFLLCCPCCRRGLAQSQRYKLYLTIFIGSFVLSIIGLVFMILGAAKLQGGLNDAVDQLEHLSDAVLTIADLAGTFARLSSTILSTFARLGDGCLGTFLDLPARPGDLRLPRFAPAERAAEAAARVFQSAQTEATSLESTAYELQESAADVATFVDDISDLFRSYFDAIVPIFGIMVGTYILVAIIVVFNAVAHKSQRYKIPRCCVGLVDYVVFPLLGVLDVLFVVVAASTFVAGIFAGDLCYPNPTVNILNILNVDGIQRLAIQRALRYWGACICCPDVVERVQANDPISSAVQEALNRIDQLRMGYSQFLDSVEDASCAVLQPPSSVCPNPEGRCCLGQKCIESLRLGQPGDNVTNDSAQTRVVLDKLQRLVGCDTIPEIYAGVLDAGVCNGIQPGLAQIGVGCVIGVGCLLVALSFRSVFNDKKEACCSCCSAVCCSCYRKNGKIKFSGNELNVTSVTSATSTP